MQQSKNPKRERDPAVLDDLQSLVAQAKAGETSALPRIRAILDHHPEIVEFVGDLDRMVTREWALVLGAGDPLAVELVQRQAAALRADLEGKEPTPIEKMLVGNVIATWLEVAYSQFQVAGRDERSPAQTTTITKRAESSLKKYLAAVKTLTTLRALMPKGLVPVSRLMLFTPEARSG